MASITWKNLSGDWFTAANWSSGTVPGASDTASFTGTGTYTCTLYQAASISGLTLNDAGALLYDAGSLAVSGTVALQAGTLALAYGSLSGGTLALQGGTLQTLGGTLAGETVQGALSIGGLLGSLTATGGLTLQGAGGSGAGSLAITGAYSVLTALGSETFNNATITLGATAAGPNQGGPASLNVSHAFGATSGATLTLGPSLWLRQAGTSADLAIGTAIPGPLADAVINQGTITVAAAGGTLAITGAGNFTNQGTLAVSNGATLELASAGFTNTGTILAAGGTLDFAGTYSATRLAALGSLSLSGATIRLDGLAQNAGNTLTVGASTALGALTLAGTIAGGTVNDLGGGLGFGPGTGVLDAVSYKGSLTLAAGAAVTLADSTSVTGPISVNGAGAELLLRGQTSLANTTLTLGGATASAGLATTDLFLASAATTATLAASLAILQTGKYANLTASGQTPIAGFGLADTLVLAGSLAANFAGGTLTLGGPGSIINQGAISASNQDTLLISAANFSNTGSLSITGGATAVLGGQPNIFGVAPAWTNAGVISVNGGTLVLSGATHTAQLGSISSTGGSISLSGTLLNTGATLSLGTAAGANLPALTLNGTITGGTILDPLGVLSPGSTGHAVLNGVTDQGLLTLGAGASLLVQNSLTLTGTAAITGAGATLAFQGVQSFDKAQVLLGAAGAAATLDVRHDATLPGGSTLTLGPNLAITQAGALAAIGSATDQGNDAITTYGGITAALSGGTFTLGGANFTNRGSIAVSNGDTLTIAAGAFSNFGSLSVTNAALSLAGSLSLAQLGSLTASNAALYVSGTLNAGGTTLALGAGSAWGQIHLSGTLANAVITDAGGGLAATGNATLQNDTYEGTLDLSRPFQTLAVAGGLTLTDSTGTQPGTVLLTGAAARLLATSSETLDNATVYLGSNTNEYYGQPIAVPELAASGANTLTLGANFTVRSAGLLGWVGDARLGGWQDTVVNDGVILSATYGGVLTLGSSFFINNGTIAEGNFGSVIYSGVSMTNAGTIAVSPGSNFLLGLYSYFSAPNAGATVFTNTGTLRMLGGVVTELTDNNLFPSIPLVNAAGGLIQGLGLIAAPWINNGLIEAKYGPSLDIAGTISGTGSLQIDPGCVLELGGAVSAGQTLSFTSTGETLQLDNASGFAAKVNGFVSGDFIDINNTPVTAVAISAGTLVLTTTTGQLRLATTNLLGGEVSVGADFHGGSLASYLQQTIGGTGGAALIMVAQPNMLFWASPVGDIFQGTSNTLNGAQIANFTQASMLDFVDLLGQQAIVNYTQGNGTGTITVTDGLHSASLTLIGTFTPSWFHVTPDSHGGAMIHYGPT